MIVDHENKKNKNKIIEALVTSEGIGVWIPVMGMKIYSVDRNGDLHPLREFQVREVEGNDSN